MSRRVDNDRAAAILVDAAYRGDEAAAELWGISPRTVQNYRARLADDPELALIFHEKRRGVERDWAASLPATIHAGTEFVQRAARQGDPKDPNMVNAVAGAIKQIAEIWFVKQMLDLRLRADERDVDGNRAVRPQIATLDTTDGEYSDADA